MNDQQDKMPDEPNSEGEPGEMLGDSSLILVSATVPPLLGASNAGETPKKRAIFEIAGPLMDAIPVSLICPEEFKVGKFGRQKPKLPKIRQQQSGTIPQICLNCSNIRRWNSSYCSKACGMDYVYRKVSSGRLEQLKKEKISFFVLRQNQIFEEIRREQVEGSIKSSFERMDLRVLEEIELEKKKLLLNRLKLNEQVEALEALLSSLNCISPLSESKDEMFTRKRASVEQLDCPNCGQPTSLHSFSFHAAMCNIKNDNSPITSPYPTPEDCSSVIYCDYYYKKDKTYCKRLKASCTLHSHLVEKQRRQDKVCGCPLDWNDVAASGRCFMRKGNCIRHVNWESIRRAHLELETISLNRLEKALEMEESLVKDKMVLRRMKNAI